MKYDEAKADHELLESIWDHHDLVPIDSECRLLMANPTKARAKSMYEGAVRLWFDGVGTIPQEYHEDVAEIAERHGCDFEPV